MTEQQEQQRKLFSPASPFNIVGFSGMGGLPAPQTPTIPDINIEDRSQAYLQQANESVQRSYETVSQTIEAVGNARAQQAASTQRNGFANAVAGTIGAIQAGMELYGTLEEKRKGRLEEERKVVAAELENTIMGHVVELRRAVGQNATDVGIVPTYTQLIRNLRQQYAPYLAPETLQEITNIAWSELQEVQAQQGGRWQAELEDVQATLLEQRKFTLTTNIMDIVNSMSHGPLSLNPGQGIPLINNKISEFLTQNDVQGMDAMRLVNSIMPTIIAAMEAGGQNSTQMVLQNQALSEVMSEAQRINEEYADNAEARNGMLAPLQLRLDQLGVGIKLSDIFLTGAERFQNQAEYIRTVAELQELQNTNAANGVPTEGIEGRAMSLVITAKAMEWVNNPVLNATEIERGSTADAPEELRAAYRIYQDFTTDQTAVREQRQIIATASANVSKAEAELARYAQMVDPTGQLGPPVLTDQYSRSLYQVLIEGDLRERPQLSRDYEAALTEWQRSNVFDERIRIQNAEATLQQLVTPWAQVGVDILNPANTQGLQNLIEGMQPVLESLRQGAAANPTNGPLAPSNFSLGLPPLPQR